MLLKHILNSTTVYLPNKLKYITPYLNRTSITEHKTIWYAKIRFRKRLRYQGVSRKITEGESKMGKKRPIVKVENGVRYILAGDRYLPDVIKPAGDRITGKYDRARARFLLNHRRDIFLQLQESGKLLEHLEKIEEEAFEMIHNIMEQMLKAEPIPESLKNTDTLQWVGLMNNYRSSAEEIVMHDLIYKEGLLEELEELEYPQTNLERVFRELSPEELNKDKHHGNNG